MTYRNMSLAKANRLGVLCVTLHSRSKCSIHLTTNHIFSKNSIKHTDLNKGNLNQWVCYSTSNDTIKTTASKEGQSNSKDKTEIEVSSIQLHQSQHDDRTSNQTDIELHSNKSITHRKLPEPPVYCCGTGCGKCVWMIYAEELKDYYQDDLGKIKEGLNLDQIEDPSVRMFVKMELGL